MNIGINENNINYLIENIAKYSSIPAEKGVTRESFTPEYKACAEFLKDYIKSCGLECYEDEMGTVFSRLKGDDENAKTVMSGSHLDSVREGGKYDGIAGIVTAIEAVRAIKEQGLPHRHNLDAVIMTEEEGTRYLSSLFSSRVMTGMVTEQELYDTKDAKGISMIEAMKAYGLSGDVKSSVRNDIKAFVELHIEQGPVLESNQKDVGIVTGIVALRAYNVSIKGVAAHAGTTPMDNRADPLVAASGMIYKLSNMAKEFGKNLVLTVGSIEALPGSANVVPYEVNFTVDLRARKLGDVISAERLMYNIIENISNLQGTEFTIDCAFSKDEAALDEDIQAMIEKYSNEFGFSNMRLPSGAGHDSQIMAKKFPTAMIFIPNKDGRSHCKEEFASTLHLKQGAIVLANVLYELAK